MYKKTKKISINVIRRLPQYYSYLTELKEKGVQKVSSGKLGEITGFTSSQIRQDLNNFGGFGIQGTGYDVSSLQSELSQILGIDSHLSAIIFEAGNLGQAIANYSGFRKFAIGISALFDINPELVGTRIHGIPVMNINEAKEYIKKNHVKIAVICTPKESAPDVVELLNDTDIKGVWNFAPVDLNLKIGIKVESVNLLNSLFVLSYLIKAEQ